MSITEKYLKKAIKEATFLEKHATEYERTEIPMNIAREKVIERIYIKYLRKIKLKRICQ